MLVGSPNVGVCAISRSSFCGCSEQTRVVVKRRTLNRFSFLAASIGILFMGEGCVTFMGVSAALPTPDDEEQVYVLTGKSPFIRGQIHKCKETGGGNWNCRHLFGFQEVEEAAWIIEEDRRRDDRDNRDRPTQRDPPPSVLMLYLNEQGSNWIPPSPNQTLCLFVRLLDEADVPDIPELRRRLIDEALLSLGFAPLPSDWGEPVGEEDSFDLDFSEELEEIQDDE